MILDEKAYDCSHSLRTAFIDGQLAMCELILGIAQRMMIEKKLTTSKIKNDFENGQISAYESMINGCVGFTQHFKNKQAEDCNYDC